MPQESEAKKCRRIIATLEPVLERKDMEVLYYLKFRAQELEHKVTQARSGLRTLLFMDAYHKACAITETTLGDDETDVGAPCLWIGRDGKGMHLDKASVSRLAAVLQTYVNTGRLPPRGTTEIELLEPPVHNEP